MEKMSLKEICLAAGGKLVGEDGFVDNVVTDNRLCKDGSLFVAIKGENHDGHKYAKAASEAGAVAVLVSCDTDAGSASKIIVDDTVSALGKISKYYLEKCNAKVLAVTGSVGKTTTRNMAHAAISEGKNAVKTIKNYNNNIGLPLTILSEVTNETEVAVLEMGMNHFGEISYLSSLACPESAIITNIGMSHIENLGSREGILKAKLEVLDGLKKDGVLILNGDDKYLWGEREKPFKKVYYGIENKEADFIAEEISYEKDKVSFTLCAKGEKYKVLLNVPGIHNVYNALSSFAAADYFNVSPDKAIAGLEKFYSSDMRLEIIKKENFTVINDCYNASPDSVLAALNVLKNMTGKKIAVLGDMLEMGSYAPDAHRETGKKAKEICDLVISVGELGKYIKEGAGEKGIWFSSKEEAEEHINREKDGSVILVKASRGMHFEEITKNILD